MTEIKNCNTEFGASCVNDSPLDRPHACAYLGPHRVHECARCGAHAPNLLWVEPPDLATEVAALRQQLDEARGKIEDRRMRLVHCEGDLLNIRGILSPNGGVSVLPPDMDIGAEVAPTIEWLVRQLDEARALAATCSCGTSPETYEGPEPDCPVHGAAQEQLAVTRIALTAAQGAHDLAEADRDRLESDLAAALNVDDWEHPADLIAMVRALRLGDEEAAEALSDRDRLSGELEAAKWMLGQVEAERDRQTAIVAEVSEARRVTDIQARDLFLACARLQADNARLLVVYRAAEALVTAPFGEAVKLMAVLQSVVDACRAGAPAGAPRESLSWPEAVEVATDGLLKQEVRRAALADREAAEAPDGERA